MCVACEGRRRNLGVLDRVTMEQPSVSPSDTLNTHTHTHTHQHAHPTHTDHHTHTHTHAHTHTQAHTYTHTHKVGIETNCQNKGRERLKKTEKNSREIKGWKRERDRKRQCTKERESERESTRRI